VLLDLKDSKVALEPAARAQWRLNFMLHARVAAAEAERVNANRRVTVAAMGRTVHLFGTVLL